MKKDLSVQYFNSGCNCSQAVVMPFAEEAGIDCELIERISVGFGGGMGKKGKTCGCISGALMVLGLKYGNESIKKIEQRINTYNHSKAFIERFEEEYGHTECNELIKLDLSKTADMEKAQKQQVFENRCSKIVARTVEILEEEFINIF